MITDEHRRNCEIIAALAKKLRCKPEEVVDKVQELQAAIERMTNVR